MSSSTSNSTGHETFSIGEAFDHASKWTHCMPCFWLFWVLLILVFVVVGICYALRWRRDWGLEEEERDLVELERHQIDVMLQENLSRAIDNYWAKDTSKEWNSAVEKEEEIMSEENAETKNLEDFNSELEARRKEFVKTMRRNAFKKKFPSEEADWSVTLNDMSDGDQLDAEALLSKLLFILPKPFNPVSTSKAYLKEEVRVALFTMLRKIHFEGYDRHVAALVASAVVVWNDGEVVKLAGKPFYPSFTLLGAAEVKNALQSPDDVDEEMKRLKEPLPEVPFKMSYENVLALEASIDKEVVDRHQRLEKYKTKQWTDKLAHQLVKILTMPRIFGAFAVMNENENRNKENQVLVRPPNPIPLAMENELAQLDEVVT